MIGGWRDRYRSLEQGDRVPWKLEAAISGSTSSASRWMRPASCPSDRSFKDVREFKNLLLARQGGCLALRGGEDADVCDGRRDPLLRPRRGRPHRPPDRASPAAACAPWFMRSFRVRSSNRNSRSRKFNMFNIPSVPIPRDERSFAAPAWRWRCLTSNAMWPATRFGEPKTRAARRRGWSASARRWGFMPRISFRQTAGKDYELTPYLEPLKEFPRASSRSSRGCRIPRCRARTGMTRRMSFSPRPAPGAERISEIRSRWTSGSRRRSATRRASPRWRSAPATPARVTPAAAS